MDDSQRLMKAKSICGPNPYNIFCAEFFKQGKYMIIINNWAGFATEDNALTWLW